MDALERFRDARIVGAALLAARVWVGSLFVVYGLEKVTGPGAEVWVGDKAGVAVGGYLNGALAMAPGGAEAGAYPEVAGWYAALIRDVFLPNAEVFSYLVAWGEVLVGIALVLGILTRLAAAMGVAMNLAFLFAGTSGENVPMLLLGLPIVFGAAAGSYGGDRFLMPAARGFLDRRRGTPERPIAGTPVPTTA